MGHTLSPLAQPHSGAFRNILGLTLPPLALGLMGGLCVLVSLYYLWGQEVRGDVAERVAQVREALSV
ncbi:hypothetical protein GCM10010840_31160 [Deinococcus aerolatus]|uniref:Uncharacterized protein n=1 Tax=Deinococcus aerolatus TaxID=522487 RepID=A0ABQ2GES9_9DEIO|nr:hypothetical protein GCM10010840_31160 [Deinococcus aerolatus]